MHGTGPGLIVTAGNSKHRGYDCHGMVFARMNVEGAIGILRGIGIAMIGITSICGSRRRCILISHHSEDEPSSQDESSGTI